MCCAVSTMTNMAAAYDQKISWIVVNSPVGDNLIDAHHGFLGTTKKGMT